MFSIVCSVHLQDGHILLLLVLCLCVALQLQIMIPELLNSTDFSQDYDSLSMCLCLYVPMLSTTQLCLQCCISIHIDIHVHLVLPPGHLIPSHCSSYFIATFCLLSHFLMVLATSSIMVLHIAPRFLVCISKSLHVFLEVCAVYLQ